MPKVFERHSTMPGSAEQMMAFHSRPRVFQTLTPLPIYIQVLRDDRTSITEGQIEFRLWLGPFPVRWLARHEPGSIPTAFIDRMLDGPMAHWEHQHIFRDLQGDVELTDRVTYEHRWGMRGLVTRLVFDGLPLRLLFLYRHWVTRRAMSKLIG